MMNDLGRRTRRYAAVLLGILGLCALRVAAEDASSYDSSQKSNEAVNSNPTATTDSSVKTPEMTIQKWPRRSRSMAHMMIEKYGQPASFDDDKLVWEKNSPWEKSVVYRTAALRPGGKGSDILEQSIAYPVPDDKVADLRKFDPRITVDKASGNLSSVAPNEKLNYLALNLADEIITGKRSVDDARNYYRKTRMLSEAGKSSAYMDGFLFPMKSGASQAPTQGAPSQTPTQGAPSGNMTNPGQPGHVVTPPNP